MEHLRSPFQGVWNILRFNWHFYFIAIGCVLFISLLNKFFNYSNPAVSIILYYFIIIPTIISLIISFYIYDLSGLYKFNWLNGLSILPNSKIVNINAGFDESSYLIRHKLVGSKLIVYDFYDPLKHTEVSIKRARRAYKPFQGTQHITTANIPLQNSYADIILVMFAAHEIRETEERIIFFHELKRVLKHDGKIVIIEHLRNVPNFIAYNIGFFHFISKSLWHKTFLSAKLFLEKELNVTPFVKIFILRNCLKTDE